MSISEIRYVADYVPVPGKPSRKASELADWCAPDCSAPGPGPADAGYSAYLEEKFVSHLSIRENRITITGTAENRLRDQKKIIVALIDQRSRIPGKIDCWLVTGDSGGRKVDASKGLHLAGMRPIGANHIVLVPTANRKRFLGPALARQMLDLKEQWIPWEKKSDTAWWGGALTGSHWQVSAPYPLTRHAVVEHFVQNPSDRIRLQSTQIPANGRPLTVDVPLQPRFKPRDAYRSKCVVLLPGNDIASGSSWYMAGNSVVLMPKPHLDHILYFDLQPWVHYVPLENDPKDILRKLDWVLDNQDKAQEIVAQAHERLRWLSGPEYLWACNEVLNRIALSQDGQGRLSDTTF